MLISTKRSVLHVARLLQKTKILSIEQSKKVKKFRSPQGSNQRGSGPVADALSLENLEVEGTLHLIPINVMASVYEALTTVFSAF